MTCIVGIEHEGKVYMGADSIGVDGWQRTVMDFPKVFHVRDLLIGCAGSIRALQLLRYNLDVRARNDSEDDMEYMVTGVADTARRLFKDSGWSHIENNKESGANFLVGYRGRLYAVEDEFSVVRMQQPYWALGVGKVYALAAILTLRSERDDLTPEHQINRALKVASELSIGVHPPFHIESL